MCRIAFTAVTSILTACATDMVDPRYPDASEIPWQWSQQVDPPDQLQKVALLDGARVEYGDGRLRCIEATGAARWSLNAPPQPDPTQGVDTNNPLAAAFYYEPRSEPVSLEWGAAALAADASLLYLAQYNSRRPGASLVALDLRNGTQVWGRSVQDEAPVLSRWSNEVAVKVLQSAVVVFGHESGGDYIMVFSPQGQELSIRNLPQR